MLEEERKDFNSEGKKQAGFASSVVPTLEEKTIAEQRPPKDQVDYTEDGANLDQFPEGGKGNGHVYRGDTPNSLNLEHLTFENTVSGEAPSNTNLPINGHEAPARSSKSDVGEEEHASPGMRAAIRDNPNKPGRKHAWTVPTKKPRVSPNDFEDPISDAFWKNIWVASAVHNVSEETPLLLYLYVLWSCWTDHAWSLRRRYTGKYFTPYRMILSRLGNSTKNS